MSEKADINKENIARALLYNRGLTAEQTVLWVFDFNIGLFETMFFNLKSNGGYATGYSLLRHLSRRPANAQRTVPWHRL